MLLNDADHSSICGSIGSGGPQAPQSRSPHASSHHHSSQQRYYTVRSQRSLHRAWLAAADARRPSWSSERPAPRKLVKDPGGSARPSAAREIREDEEAHDDHNGKSASSATGVLGALGIRRKMARWRDLRQ